ncbi:MAG: exo-alpha-sialidase [Deferribacteres bacterium]|nr:exo-alpha-sialidase [candidate division KSB1 bacterium]MCB9502225.1 exo-alpha-sialidase [Deferribacteres bacterium]
MGLKSIIMTAIFVFNCGESVISMCSAMEKIGLINEEFIFEKAPFRECHASTIVELKNGDLMSAWFGGTHEKNPDVVIWLSRKKNGQWQTPVKVADGIQHDKKRYPCWNPVLFQPVNGPLLLFYKVGPHPSTWWGMLMTSMDNGKTWSEPRRLPEDIYGPIKNKPLQFEDGVILCPSSTENNGWRVHFELMKDIGKTWEFIEPINDPKIFEAIQPTLLTYSDGSIQALCRSRQKRIVETWSHDSGKTWSKMKATSLPNPSAGFDGITLQDGRGLLVYNHTTEGRAKLNVAISQNGINWDAALILEDQPGQYSYPAVIQTKDGMVHVTYTYDLKRIKHVVIDPDKLKLEPLWDFQ